MEEGYLLQDNIKLVDSLIIEAIRAGCSDVHIEPMSDYIRIRNRLFGDLQVTGILPIEKHSAIVTRLKILADLDIAEKRLPQDGRIGFYCDEKKIDLRVSTIPTVNGEKVELRILDPKKFEIGFQDLGITNDDINQLIYHTNIENGMIIFAGLTGSGKTTSLYTLLKKDNVEKVNIVTVEDPVEYKMDGINQIQINEGANVRFDNTLRSILRQDPDIIQIGEIRDTNTAKIAMQAAITGHKVYTTLHTDDVYSSVIRLLDMGVEDYLIKAAVRLIVSQRLIKKLCPFCKETRLATIVEKEFFESYGLTVETLYEKKGCERCKEGYIGRMAVMEILPMDQELIRAIKGNIDLSKLKEIGAKRKVRSIIYKALLENKKGNTGFEEVMKLNYNLNYGT